jgi:hypothetical protein
MSYYNLQRFRQITKGFTRGCNFEIGIVGQDGNGWQDTTAVLSAFATSMGLPTRNFSTQPITIQYGLFPVNVPSGVTFTPWTVTFMGDDMMTLRNMFVGWQEMIYNTRAGAFSCPVDYKVDNFWAAVLNTRDIPVQVYRFYGLWPLDVQGLTVSQADTNVIQFSVTFSYDLFKMDDLTTWQLVKQYISDRRKNSNHKQDTRVGIPSNITI